MECPICKGDFDPEISVAMPFCSERCRSIDLGRWLGEGYSLPHVPDPEDDEIPDEDFASRIGKELPTEPGE